MSHGLDAAAADAQNPWHDGRAWYQLVSWSGNALALVFLMWMGWSVGGGPGGEHFELLLPIYFLLQAWVTFEIALLVIALVMIVRGIGRGRPRAGLLLDWILPPPAMFAFLWLLDKIPRSA